MTAQSYQEKCTDYLNDNVCLLMPLFSLNSVSVRIRRMRVSIPWIFFLTDTYLSTNVVCHQHKSSFNGGSFTVFSAL